jgi:small-conductance mechanosensitive channel
VGDAREGWFVRHSDLVATVLLALAAVATAWATYQGAHWRGEQALAGGRSTAARVEATRVEAVANRQIQIDVQLFTQWVNAYSRTETKLAAFYFRRFRPEFRPAVTAWIATKPLVNAKAPLSPFDMPQYSPAALKEADALEARAAAETRTAQRYVENSDRYTLCVVLFATALFFAGISTRVRSAGPRAWIQAMGWVILIAAVAWMATFPVDVRL